MSGKPHIVRISANEYEVVHSRKNVVPNDVTSLQEFERSSRCSAVELRRRRPGKPRLPPLNQPVEGATLDGKPIELSESEKSEIRSERHRDWFLEEYFGLTRDQDLETTLKWLCFHSTAASTFYSYCTIYKALLDHGDPQFDFTRPGCKPQHVLNCYLAAYGDCEHIVKSKSLKSYQTAINHYCDAMGLNGPAAQQKLLRGGLNSQRPAKDKVSRPRGAITYKMMKELIKYVKSRGPEFALYVDGFIIQHAFALRNEQVGAARLTEFVQVTQPVGRGSAELLGFRYVALRHKVYNRNQYVNSDLEKHSNNVSWNSELYEIFQRAQARAAETDNWLAVPGWKGQVACRLVKEAAKALGWSSDVDWVDHGIRHGAAVDAAANSKDRSIEGQILAAQEQLQHKSPRVTLRYMESEENRQLLGRANKALAAGKPIFDLVGGSYTASLDNQGRTVVHQMDPYGKGHNRKVAVVAKRIAFGKKREQELRLLKKKAKTETLPRGNKKVIEERPIVSPRVVRGQAKRKVKIVRKR